jgi:hypothetical protein
MNEVQKALQQFQPRGIAERVDELLVGPLVKMMPASKSEMAGR